MLTPIFLCSLVFVLLMIAIKVYEYVFKKRTFVTALISHLDKPLGERIVSGARTVDTARERIFTVLVHEFPKQTKYFFLLLRKQVQEKYSSVLLDTRGSRVLKSDAAVSPFLKDIARDKEENRGGIIRDESI